MTQNFMTDIAVIGAGPAGLFTVFQAGMLGLTCQVIDSLEGIGGQCAALYPEKPIYDIPGFPAVMGGELIEQLSAQAAPFSPTYHLGQQVVELARNTGQTFTLVTDKEHRITARVIIIAAGGGAFGPNRPPLDGIENYEGTSVHYMVKRRQDYTDKNIVIAGGGDSAVDWAISLAEVANKIYVVHRRDKFRAAADSLKKLQALHDSGTIELVVPYQLKALSGADQQLQTVTVETLDGEVRALPADYLLAFFGLSMELGPIANWGLNLTRNHITIDPTTCRTSEPGIYAVGDIATYEHKLKLILCGFSEAAIAVHDARKYMNPGVDYHFEYSTSKGVPGEEKAAA